MNERDIFIAAMQKKDAAERQVYLRKACGDNAALREHLEGLLEAFEKAGSFLEAAPPGGSRTITDQNQEGPGTLVRPYKRLQQIGEGGMGVFYMAEQTAPVQRKVALKIIRPGMDSRQVIARFEAERQALALMDHPHIAKVLDAGTTGASELDAQARDHSFADAAGSGRPYFVMELVKGVPITKYCD